MATLSSWNFKEWNFLAIALALFFFSPVLSAEKQFIQGDGHFISKEEDSLSFVKKQLLASAFRDIITKELKAMGLDHNLFWQQYDKKFHDYFESSAEKLKEKYGVEDGKVPDDRQREYQKALRRKRLKAKASFGRLNRAILSYSIQRMSRSTQMPNSRYLSLQAKVDRKLLSKIYYNFTRKGEARHFNKLFLTTRYQLKEMNWQDTGVQLERDFTEVVDKHWKQWLQDHLSSYVEEVVLTDPSLKKRLEKFLLMSPEIGAGLRPGNSMPAKERDGKGKQKSDGEGEEKDEEPANRLVEREMSEFTNSLWLNISVQIRKIDERPFLKTRKFEIDGEFVLVDLKTNKLVKSFDFIREIKDFSTSDSHELSSNLASLIYRTPVIEFEKLSQAFSKFSAGLQRLMVEVNSLNSVQELMQVSSLLQEEGVTARVSTSIEFYDGETGRLQVQYYGKEEKLRDILYSLDQKKIRDGRKVSLPQEDKPYLLNIRSMSSPKREGENESS